MICFDVEHKDVNDTDSRPYDTKILIRNICVHKSGHGSRRIDSLNIVHFHCEFSHPMIQIATLLSSKSYCNLLPLVLA